MTDQPPNLPDAGSIILMQCDDAYWLLQGEPHMHALLGGSPGYPTPVYCVDFDNMLDAVSYLGAHDTSLEALWGIHPNIAKRLTSDGEMRHLQPGH